MCQNWRFYLLRRFCITNISIFSLSFFCRVFPLALFFSYLFSFGVLFWFILVFFQQWRMTWLASSDCITDFCQNWSFLKLWRFEYYEEFKIWFSLFCRVLLLALFFSYLFLFRVYFVVTNDITILPASSVCITDCRQKRVLFEPLENLALRTVWNLVFLCFVEFCI